MTSKYISTATASKQYGISKRTLQRLAKTKQVTHLRLSKEKNSKIWFTETELNKYFDLNTTGELACN